MEEKSPYNTLSDTRLKAGEERTLPFEIKIPYRAKAGRGTLRASAFIRHADGDDSPAWTLQEIPYPIQ